MFMMTDRKLFLLRNNIWHFWAGDPSRESSLKVFIYIKTLSWWFSINSLNLIQYGEVFFICFFPSSELIIANITYLLNMSFWPSVSISLINSVEHLRAPSGYKNFLNRNLILIVLCFSSNKKIPSTTQNWNSKLERTLHTNLFM